jgi:hypothetical protein
LERSDILGMNSCNFECFRRSHKASYGMCSADIKLSQCTRATNCSPVNDAGGIPTASEISLLINLASLADSFGHFWRSHKKELRRWLTASHEVLLESHNYIVVVAHECIEPITLHRLCVNQLKLTHIDWLSNWSGVATLDIVAMNDLELTINGVLEVERRDVGSGEAHDLRGFEGWSLRRAKIILLNTIFNFGPKGFRRFRLSV